MVTKDAVIQDLNNFQRTVITKMVITHCVETGGMLLFTHPDNTVTVVKLKDGWSVSMTARED